MLKNIYVIRDYKVGYTNLVLDLNDDVAIRGFKSILTPDTLQYNNPKDFALFKVGIFDTETGFIEPIEPLLVEEAYNLMPKGE